jgi:SulP family sulfate permease
MKRLPISRENLTADLLAGLTTSIVGIPDAMASAVLAGVSPIHGLYAMMAGTPVAALTISSLFMSVVLTSAMVLAVGDALAGLSGEALIQALVVLTLLLVGGF